MPIFFIVFLSVIGLANFYVIRRFMQGAIMLPEKLRYILLVFFIICSISYIAAKFIASRTSFWGYDVLLWIGSIWIAILLYGFLYCASVDLYRITRYIIIWISKSQLSLPLLSVNTVFIMGIVMILSIIGYGYWNAAQVKLSTMNIDIAKSDENKRTMKILYFSDLHLTPIHGDRNINQIISAMESTKPDLILMGGDVVDDKSIHLYRHGLDKKLQQLTAPLGVFTCPGNHEYISGKSDAFQFLQASGVTVLADTTIVVDGRLQITGRDDISSTRENQQPRKSIMDLSKGLSQNLPSIVLDHQPFSLEKAVAAGYGLQLSGHTHHGQMFPINLITNKIYEKSWGYLKKSNTHFYISSGAGTWGPPVRLGSNCEMILINLSY